ncbi:MAG: tetratricopeptide repeat protein [Bacteroidia bacterium]|nr:tetratricopeptide repeat protein [Bacteroidia bacterium]
MKKIILLSIVCFQFVAAQTEFVLKKPLSKGDILFLKQQLREYNFFEQSMNFQFQAGDFFKQKVVAEDKAFDAEEIKKLKAKLKGDCEDAAIYYDIGMAYKFNYKYEDALFYLNKSLDRAKERTRLKPDSASAYRKLGVVFVGLENFKEALSAFEKACKLDKKDDYSREMKKSLPYNLGENATGDSLILDEIKQNPDSLCGYAALPVYYLSNIFAKLSVIPDRAKKLDLLRNKKVEDLADLSLIKNAAEKNENEICFELIYRVSELCILMGKTVHVSFGDTGISKAPAFILDEYDKKTLTTLTKFFESCLTNKNIPDQYVIHKSLAIIATLKTENAKAKAEIREAIKIRQLLKPNFYTNASGEYDNLAAIYFLDKDTAGLEKILLEKTKINPGINPAPEDFVKLAQLSFYYKKYDKAKEYAERALSICETVAGANQCLTAIALINNDLTGALEPLKKEQRIAPESFSFLMIGGIYSLMANDTDVAAACFQTAQQQAQDKSEIQKKFINKFLAPAGK